MDKIKLKKYMLYALISTFLGNNVACSSQQEPVEITEEEDFSINIGTSQFPKIIKETLESSGLSVEDLNNFLMEQSNLQTKDLKNEKKSPLTAGDYLEEIQKALDKYDITIKELKESLSKNEYAIPTKSTMREDLESGMGTTSYINKLSISYDKSYPENFEYIENNYGPYIEQVSRIYGLSSSLLKAIYSQEFGIKTNNIGQIEESIWNHQTITAYNFETNEYETIKINDDCFFDPYQNIKISSMILQREIYNLNGHILAGIQGYNYGSDVVKNRIKKYAKDNGLSIENILCDQSNLDWLDYIKIYKNGEFGDPNYIEHVLSHIEEDNYSLYIALPNQDMNYIEIIRNKEKEYTK